MLVLLCLGAFLAASCSPPQRWAGDYSQYPLVDPDLDPQVAQALMHEWTTVSSDTFQAGMDEVAERTTDPTLADNIHRFTTAFKQGIRRSGWRIEPIGAAYDSWLFLQQVDRFLAGEDATDAFGPLLPDVGNEVDKVQALLDVVLDEMVFDLDAAYDERIATWVDENPLEGLELARVSPVIELAVATDQVRDAWQAVARAEFTATAAYARLNDALLTLPPDLRRQIEAAIRGIMREPLVVNALVGFSRLGDGMKELAAAVEDLDRGLDDHRDAILEEVDRERMHTIEVLQSEREIVLAALSGERQAFVDALADERKAIIDAIDAERQTIAGLVEVQVATVMEDARAMGADAVERSASRLRGIALLASLVLAGGFVLGLVALGFVLRTGQPRA